MPFYSDEVIKNIEEEFRLFLIDKSQYAEIATLISIIAPNNTLQTQLSRADKTSLNDGI